jgi:hypothetical protein
MNRMTVIRSTKGVQMLHQIKFNSFLLSAACGVALSLILHAQLHADDESTQGQAERTEALSEQKDDDASSPPSLDDLLGLEEEEQDHSADEAARRDHEEELERRLSEERLTDAFAEAIAKMSLSAEMLEDRFDTGLGTQRVQEEIIEKLTQLIDEAQQMQSSSSSSSSSASASAQPQQSPGQQGGRSDQSSPSNGQDGEGNQEQDPPPTQQADVNVMLEEMRQEWGSLPDRIREMLLQGREERFSGLYEQLTREYYRRLAED